MSAIRRTAVFVVLACVPALSPAQQAADAITITATRSERPSLEVPASIDSVSADRLRDYQPRVNLSESLNGVPGVVVSNRQNYAQDLQITSRGFGARSTFGVRGIRLIQDGIPATMPDGSGQAGSFGLSTAARVEVLRGPFSTLYGNASGGVIQIFTADGPPQPEAGAEAWAGSYGSARYALSAGGEAGRVNYNGDLSRFSTDGYRDHSAATRDLANGKLRVTLEDGSRLTFVGNAINQAGTQDPGGLNAAQLSANRRQVDPGVLLFNTRKSIAQSQLGGTWDKRLANGDSLSIRLYGGDRDVTQFLALSGAAITSSGGVVNLSTAYSGSGLRWQRKTELAGRPLTLSAGAEFDTMAQRRQGYVNNNGVQGALRRDEDDAATSAGAYVQAEWHFGEHWSALAGIRRTSVSVAFADHFVVPGNGDDSGTLHFHSNAPAASLQYLVSKHLDLYLSYGRGFETPTLAELAYTAGGSGPNFGLQPATSRQVEIGAKAVLFGDTRVDLALFSARTSNEIVVASSAGGRTVFRNAAHTLRRGAELSWEIPLPHYANLRFAYSHLNARFTDAFTSTGPVAAGNSLPAVPRDVLYAELAWRHPQSGFGAALEARRSSRVYVDDLNSAFAPAYTIVNLRGGFEQQRGRWKLTEFMRIENLFNASYVGSVIVADSNGRYFEAAPGHNWIAGMQAKYAF